MKKFDFWDGIWIGIALVVIAVAIYGAGIIRGEAKPIEEMVTKCE